MSDSWKQVTRERSEGDEIVREFDIVSAATVMSAAIGLLFLTFFLAAFLPWLLAKGMTSAVEGLMSRIGFQGFTIETIWSWLLVLVIFAVFTAFIVAIATAILYLYNLLSERTGRGFRLGGRALEVRSGAPALSAPAKPVKRTASKPGTSKRTASKPGTSKPGKGRPVRANRSSGSTGSTRSRS